MFVPAVTLTGATFKTPMSADAVTLVVTVDVSLAGTGSGVVLDLVTVLLSVLPDATFAFTATTTLKTAVDPFVNVPIVLLMLVAVLLRVNAGPLVWLCETKLVPTGSVSFNATVCASLGPLLVIVNV